MSIARTEMSPHLATSEKAQAWAAWTAAVAFVLYLFGFQTGYAAVNASIQQELGLSLTQLGAIAATYTWSFALFQLFGGALLDRLGGRRVLLPAIAIFTSGVFLFASASTYRTLIAAQLVLALGACCGFVGAGYMGGRWFGMAKFSFMFGLVQCFASLFSAFNQNMLALAVQNLQWRQLCTWTGVVGLAVLAFALVFLRDPTPPQGLQRSRDVWRLIRQLGANIGQIVRIPHVWLAAGFGALTFGALLAAGVVWGPKLMLAHGLSKQTANLSASMLWLGLACGCIVVPWLSDRLGHRKLPTVLGITLQLLALMNLVHMQHPVPAVALGLWLLFGFGAAAHMLAFSTAADVVKPQLIGTSAAVVNGTMFLVSGLLIARPGQLAERFDSGTPLLQIAERAMVPLEIGLAIAFVLAVVIGESHPRALEP